MIYLKSFLLASMFILPACGIKIQKPESRPDQPSAQSLLILQEDLLRYELQGLPVPQQYEVLLRWPAVPGTLHILKDGELRDIVPGDATSYRDNLRGGQRPLYILQHYNEKQELLKSFSVEMSVPVDTIWGGDLQLTQSLHLKTDRLFLLPGTTITTWDHNLNIEAQEIFLHKNLIQNFPPGQQASWAQRGRKGGRVHIDASKAQGDLHVSLNGEIGGPGKRGTTFPNGRSCAGGPGGAGGQAGSLYLSIVEKEHLNLFVSNNGGAGGKAGSRGAVSNPHPEDPSTVGSLIHCARLPQGPDGPNGAPGLVEIY